MNRNELRDLCRSLTIDRSDNADLAGRVRREFDTIFGRRGPYPDQVSVYIDQLYPTATAAASPLAGRHTPDLFFTGRVLFDRRGRRAPRPSRDLLMPRHDNRFRRGLARWMPHGRGVPGLLRPDTWVRVDVRNLAAGFLFHEARRNDLPVARSSRGVVLDRSGLEIDVPRNEEYLASNLALAGAANPLAQWDFSETELMGELDCWVIDVGQAEAILFATEDREHAFMVDCGLADGEPDDKLLNFIESLGIQSLDFILLTHWHADHVNNLDYLLQNGLGVGAFISALDELKSPSIQDAFQACNQHGVGFYYYDGPMNLQLGDATLSLLYPFVSHMKTTQTGQSWVDTTKVTKNINNHSLVSQVFGLQGDILLSGDAETGAWSRIKKQQGTPPRLPCGIYKAAHHGSHTGCNPSAKGNNAQIHADNFINQFLQPDDAAISFGGNIIAPDPAHPHRRGDDTHGHPHDPIYTELDAATQLDTTAAHRGDAINYKL